MEVCSDGHDEICHNSMSCPCCDLITALNEMEEELADAQNDIDELSNQLAEATDE